MTLLYNKINSNFKYKQQNKKIGIKLKIYLIRPPPFSIIVSTRFRNDFHVSKINFSDNLFYYS